MKTLTIRRVTDLLEAQLEEAADNAVELYARLQDAKNAKAESLPAWQGAYERAAAILEEARVSYIDFAKQDWDGSSYVTESNVGGHSAVKEAARIIREAKERIEHDRHQ